MIRNAADARGRHARHRERSRSRDASNNVNGPCDVQMRVACDCKAESNQRVVSRQGCRRAKDVTPAMLMTKLQMLSKAREAGDLVSRRAWMAQRAYNNEEAVAGGSLGKAYRPRNAITSKHLYGSQARQKACVPQGGNLVGESIDITDRLSVMMDRVTEPHSIKSLYSMSLNRDAVVVNQREARAQLPVDLDVEHLMYASAQQGVTPKIVKAGPSVYADGLKGDDYCSMLKQSKHARTSADYMAALQLSASSIQAHDLPEHIFECTAGLIHCGVQSATACVVVKHQVHDGLIIDNVNKGADGLGETSTVMMMPEAFQPMNLVKGVAVRPAEACTPWMWQGASMPNDVVDEGCTLSPAEACTLKTLHKRVKPNCVMKGGLVAISPAVARADSVLKEVAEVDVFTNND